MPIPQKMKCIKITKFGSPENLQLAYNEVPTISENEVLIHVKASGVNRPDILQRKGLYLPPVGASKILGLEVSGKVVKVGKRVKFPKINQKVCALVHGGGYAEFCKVHYSHVLSIPKGLSYIEAAGIPETYFTVWANLFDIAKIKKNNTVLIHGGSSGIGTTAIQLAKNLGCRVITTVRNEKKKRFCEDLGADLAIVYSKENFFKQAQNFTKKKGVDIILDMIGKSYFNKNLKLLKNKGKFISIAFLTGKDVKLNLSIILQKKITITGSTLRPRTIKEKARIAKSVKKLCWTLFENKVIKPIIYKTFSLNEPIKAHKLMESNEHIGKIILINQN